MRLKSTDEKKQWNAERQLLAAVLYRARQDCGVVGIRSTVNPVERTKDSAHHSAIFWCFGPSDPATPFSFAWICDLLELDPGIVRKSIYKNMRTMAETVRGVDLCYAEECAQLRGEDVRKDELEALKEELQEMEREKLEACERDLEEMKNERLRLEGIWR